MPILVDPLDVRGLRLKNRIVMPPMQASYWNPDAFSDSPEGVISAQHIEHYASRSKALGLQIVEHHYVSVEGKHNGTQLGIHDDHTIPSLESLASGVHATGTPILVQINHAGGIASKEATGTTPVAPSATENARALRIEEIDSIAEAFADAAERAMRAGFDGVEIHGAHGYLLNQFYSPLANRRSDEYGGSLENRMRFPLQVVERVRERIGGRLLLYRLGADDNDKAGVRIEDSKLFSVKLEESGVDIIDVSGGLGHDLPAYLKGAQGFFIPQAQAIKAVVNTPVIGVGGITEPKYADTAIREGRVDLVAVGRALLRDPNWALKAIKAIG